MIISAVSFRNFLTWMFSREKYVNYFSFMTDTSELPSQNHISTDPSALPNITIFDKLQLGCDAEYNSRSMHNRINVLMY